jgi:hypothetical protein
VDWFRRQKRQAGAPFGKQLEQGSLGGHPPSFAVIITCTPDCRSGVQGRSPCRVVRRHRELSQAASFPFTKEKTEKESAGSEEDLEGTWAVVAQLNRHVVLRGGEQPCGVKLPIMIQTQRKNPCAADSEPYVALSI